MRKLFSILFVVIFCTFLGLSTVSFVGAAEKNEITFGFSAPLTGAMSHIGEKIVHGYKIWEEMVNDAGGIYVKEHGKKLAVKLKYYDDKSEPTASAKLYEKLISTDNVDFVLSPYGSSIGFPVSGICQKYKMPIVFLWVSSDPIYKQGYDYAFCTIQPASRHCWTPVNVLKDSKIIANPPNKILFITSKELYNITAGKGGMERAEQLGFSTEYEEVEKGVKDFTAVITKAKRSDIDGVIAALYPEDFFLFFRQMQEFAYRPKYVNGLHGPDLPDFWESFGERAEGIVTGGYYEASWPTYQNKEYVSRYEKKWGVPPQHYGATGACGQIMQQAIEKAGTLDREKVRQVLLTEEFKCILYPKVKYVNEGEYTNINKYAFTGVKQWQKGKLVTIYPKELAKEKMIYPFPAKY